MTEQEVKEIAHRHVPQLINALGIDIQDVQLYYEPIDKENEAALAATDIHHVETYRHAYITLYYERLRDENQIVEVLIHELLHVKLAPIETFFATWKRLIPKKQRVAYTYLYNHALERTVSGLQIGLSEGALKQAPKDGSAA